MHNQYFISFLFSGHQKICLAFALICCVFVFLVSLFRGMTSELINTLEVVRELELIVMNSLSLVKATLSVHLPSILLTHYIN